MPLSLSALVLIAVNLVPLAGVLFLDWSLSAIMVLYWLENGIIGVLNLFKMALASGGLGRGAGLAAVLGHAAKLFMIPFFTVHYGMFWYVHGVFVLDFFGPADASGAGAAMTPASVLEAISTMQGTADGGFRLALLSLLASHVLSFVVNYLGRGEYRSSSLHLQMFQPYGRVVVLHLTILLGGFLAMALGAPAYALLVMVGFKTVVDLYAHLREHRPKTPSPATVPTPAA